MAPLGLASVAPLGQAAVFPATGVPPSLNMPSFLPLAPSLSSTLLGAPPPPPPGGLPPPSMPYFLPGALRPTLFGAPRPPPPGAPPPPSGDLFPRPMTSFLPEAPPPPPPTGPPPPEKPLIRTYNWGGSSSPSTGYIQGFARYGSSALTESSSLDNQPPSPPPPPAHIRAKSRFQTTLVSCEKSGSIPDEGNTQLYSFTMESVL